MLPGTARLCVGDHAIVTGSFCQGPVSDWKMTVGKNAILRACSITDDESSGELTIGEGTLVDLLEFSGWRPEFNFKVGAYSYVYCQECSSQMSIGDHCYVSLGAIGTADVMIKMANGAHLIMPSIWSKQKRKPLVLGTGSSVWFMQKNCSYEYSNVLYVGSHSSVTYNARYPTGHNVCHIGSNQRVFI